MNIAEHTITCRKCTGACTVSKVQESEMTRVRKMTTRQERGSKGGREREGARERERERKRE